MKTILIITVLALFAFVPDAFAQDAPPSSFDPHHYFVWLQHSQTPTAKLMRQKINNGPVLLAQEEALAKSEGIPVTASQLQTSLPPPDQNAAPLYEKLTKLLHDKPLNLPVYGEMGMGVSVAYTPEQIAAVRKLLADRQDVMTLIHEAADKPKCVFEYDWSKGPEIVFPDFGVLRYAVRLLKTESYLMARNGQYLEAIKNQSLGFRVAEQAASAPTTLTYIDGIGCEAITLSGIQSILESAGPNDDLDEQAQRVITKEHSRLSLRNAVAGDTGLICVSFGWMHQSEKYGLLNMLQYADLGHPEINGLKTASPKEQQFAHNMIAAWQADFIHQMRLLVQSCNKPVSIRRAAFANASNKDFSHPENFVKIISYAMLPVYSRMDENDTRIRTRENCALASAAILDDIAKTGAVPEQLPGDFLDPFSGFPLQYRREGDKGFVVYSVGPTGHFDGGKPGQKPPGAESLFRYPLSVPVPPDTAK